ncbi:MAG: hypothetical protein LBV43_11505 [Prevotella sp.]|jgi:hypothetical protein|nr:hypothetical protein [Prevotella sp.]
MKNSIVILIIAVLLLSSSCGSKTKKENAETQNTETTKTDAPSSKLVELAAKMNKDMPQVFPGGIRVDKVEAVSKTEFKYYYTFTQDPIVSVEEFERATKPMLSMAMQTAKGEEDIDLLKKNKMTVIYAYYKMDKSLFAEVKLEPKDYIKK